MSLVNLVGTITCQWSHVHNKEVCQHVGTPVCPEAGKGVTMPAGCIPFKKCKNSGGCKGEGGGSGGGGSTQQPGPQQPGGNGPPPPPGGGGPPPPPGGGGPPPPPGLMMIMLV